jgi:XTP/dITP diphosphohydrolase
MTTDRPSPLLELVEVMARLRRECAWKAGQTHLSLARYLLEETYETLEAIESGDDDHLREELGDLLLQVLFHAVIAEEQGRFDIDDVAADLVVKLRRRNPHVFDPVDGEVAPGPEAINEQWERIKAEEKQRAGLMEGVPEELPALLRAVKALDRLERTGDRPHVDPTSDDLGERLLALTIEARATGVDPEQALRAAVRRILPPAPGPAV